MLTLISPSKSLDFETPLPPHSPSEPRFLDDSQRLVDAVRKLSASKLMALMEISQKLADLNVARFKAFSLPMTPDNARPAMFAFDGDVYAGLKAYDLSQKDIAFAQDHLRILSGLYGLLRPLDLIQPYRLEMGLPFKVGRAKNLYAFWGDRLAQSLESDLAEHASPVIVNLASQEYASALPAKAVRGRMITPAFKELRNGKAQIVSFFAKQARGAMARFILTQRVDAADGLKDFSDGGYRYDAKLSDADHPVFTRKS